MNPIEIKQQELLEDFEFFTDWTDKYKYIIDLGKELTPFPDEYKKEEYKVKGCQSQVWIYVEIKDGTLLLFIDSDSHIVKGLAAMILFCYNNQKPEDILSVPKNFSEKFNFGEGITMQRLIGLDSILNKIKEISENFNPKKERG